MALWLAVKHSVAKIINRVRPKPRGAFLPHAEDAKSGKEREADLLYEAGLWQDRDGQWWETIHDTFGWPQDFPRGDTEQALAWARSRP